MSLNLRFDCQQASIDGENRHPQKVMRSLNIEYDRAKPQSMVDQWWFFNCRNAGGGLVRLPRHISEMRLKPEGER